MSVNWQLKKPANNCTGMYWAANIEHRVIAKYCWGGPEFSPFSRSQCRNRQLCLAWLEQHVTKYPQTRVI